MQVTLLTPDGLPYNPLPAQAAFHSSPATFRAYVGGFGCGKTLAGVMEDLVTALEYPGSFGLVTRFTYSELESTTFKDLLAITPPGIIESFNKSSLLLTLKNGSQIQGFNASNQKRLTSLNIGWFHVDECTEVGQELFLQLAGRMRHPIGPGKGWLTGNPNGRDWVYQLFVAEQKAGYGFFHAKTAENTNLPEAYYARLRDLYPEDWLIRFCEGSFDSFEGQVFPEFNQAIHVIPQEHLFPIPAEWPRFRALDHGVRDPTCCLWAASDFAGNIYIYDMIYRRGRLISENCAEIVEKTGGDIIDWTVIDPSTKNIDAVLGSTYQDEYRRCGVQSIAGNNNILDGIMRIKELLHIDPLRVNPVTGVQGSPRLFVFPSCSELIWEMQQYKWIDQKPGSLVEKEKPVGKNDHAIDPLRYLLQQRPREASVDSSSGQWNRWEQLLSELRDEDTRADADMYSDCWRNLDRTPG